MKLRESAAFKYEASLIIKKLDDIQRNIAEIKHIMEEVELTPEEENDLRESIKEYKEGKCISLKELEKCLESE